MKKSDQLYIGLMSGTSIDGIDVALVRFDDKKCELLHFYNHPIAPEIKKQLAEISSPLVDLTRNNQNRIELLATLDNIIGHIFADAVNQFLKINRIASSKITAIGSHGQTIRHRPTNQHPFTLQIGDANIIAHKTKIPVIADFRRMDLAAGGQGAPLAPAFHNAILRGTVEDRIILNLGGIANISLMPKDKNQDVIGFDTGPANTLLDAWYKKNHPNAKDNFDRDSQFAQQGEVHPQLLAKLLDDPYFQLDHPKSTGREYFCLDWLEKTILQIKQPIKAQDIQRTLLALTVKSISNAIKKLSIKNDQIFACGGGMHNAYLLDLLSRELTIKVQKTNDIGIDGDYLEAMTFAWLAKQRLEQLPGNLPSVTGASRSKILGAVYLP